MLCLASCTQLCTLKISVQIALECSDRLSQRQGYTVKNNPYLFLSVSASLVVHFIFIVILFSPSALLSTLPFASFVVVLYVIVFTFLGEKQSSKSVPSFALVFVSATIVSSPIFVIGHIVLSIPMRDVFPYAIMPFWSCYVVGGLVQSALMRKHA